MEINDRIDVDKPLWNQKTYLGRWKHMAFITDCRTLFVSTKDLYEAKKLCESYKTGNEPPSTTMIDIICAKKLRDSAFHPDTGELMHTIGRMSFQLPSSVILTTMMLTFYKSVGAIIGCQLVNQGLSAFINHTNRNAMSDEPQDKNFIKEAFLCATATGCAIALPFRKLICSRGSVAARLIPLWATIIGAMVNLPIVRQREIIRGIPITSEEDESATCIMKSKVAAIKGISECVITRIAMATPGMFLIPVITHRINSYCFFQRRPWITFPMHLCLCTACLLVMVPSGLAIFPQQNSLRVGIIKLNSSEYQELQERLSYKQLPKKMYYNKGL